MGAGVRFLGGLLVLSSLTTHERLQVVRREGAHRLASVFPAFCSALADLQTIDGVILWLCLLKRENPKLFPLKDFFPVATQSPAGLSTIFCYDFYFSFYFPRILCQVLHITEVKRRHKI